MDTRNQSLVGLSHRGLVPTMGYDIYMHKNMYISYTRRRRRRRRREEYVHTCTYTHFTPRSAFALLFQSPDKVQSSVCSVCVCVCTLYIQPHMHRDTLLMYLNDVVNVSTEIVHNNITYRALKHFRRPPFRGFEGQL